LMPRTWTASRSFSMMPTEANPAYSPLMYVDPIFKHSPYKAILNVACTIIRMKYFGCLVKPIE
jgi:hypothetical protein